MAKPFHSHDVLRARLLAPLRHIELRALSAEKVLEKLDHKWNESFVQNMRVRLQMGSFRYSAIEDRFPHCFYLDRASRCLDKYRRTKNKEFLIDAANYCMLEFNKPQITGTFFKPTDREDAIS